MSGVPQLTPIHSRIRARQLWAGSVLVFGGLALKLVAVQAIGRAARARLAYVARVLAPPRGTIRSREGTVLATSVAQHRAVLNAQQVASPTATADTIADELGLPRRTLLAKLVPGAPRRKPPGYVLVKDRLTEVEVDRLRARAQAYRPASAEVPNPWLGLSFETSTRRQYPQGPVAAQLLGAVQVHNLEQLCGELDLSYDLLQKNERLERGTSGIELALDDQLFGRPGFLKAPADARGHPIPGRMIGARDPIPGHEVTLTLDEPLQRSVEQILQRALTAHQPRYVTAIVMKSRTGEILAMATAPGYHPDRFPAGDATRTVNWATSALYEPGSTFKVLVAAAVVDALPQWRQLRGNCSGSHQFNGRTVRCWILNSKGHGHGRCDLPTGIRESCNMAMAEFGHRLGRERMLQYIRRFQILSAGDEPERLIPGNRPGQVPPVKEITSHTLAGMSFGQHVATTPLGLLRAVNVIANDGSLVHPQLVLEVRDAEGTLVRPFVPRLQTGIIGATAARAVRDMLVDVVAHGTGKRAQLPGVKVAGKTGTAQVAIGKGGYVSGRSIVSFVGFAPADRPEVSVIVMANSPRRPANPSGGLVAAPVFKEILEASLTRLRRMQPAYALR